MDALRWTIDELLARYELEPELRDAFVEGRFDREVLASALKDRNGGETIYEIDSVDVPATVLGKYGLSSGNKQRIIALSRELSGLPGSAKVLCLADRDTDHWFEELESTDRLRWSKYCSIECHFLSAETIIDIVVTTGGAKITNAEHFVNSLTATLKTLYAMRLADRELNLGVKWVSLRKYLSRCGDAISFNCDGYCAALLNSNSKGGVSGDYSSSWRRWLQRLNCDVRLACRGHDYTSLLAWSIAEFGGIKEMAKDIAVARLFVLLAASIETIRGELE